MVFTGAMPSTSMLVSQSVHQWMVLVNTSSFVLPQLYPEGALAVSEIARLQKSCFEKPARSS